ncbi:hypothetical protein N9T96_00015 [Flavobacteriaceae bacterium]|nr:hypothetical protein [Flavobacteriaceae bacterium]
MKKRVFIVFIFLFSIGFSQTTSIEYLIVAGGGGGASGGGGAGGVLQSTNYSIPMNTDISVIVGAGGSFGTGGAGSSGAIIGGNGGNSSINGPYLYIIDRGDETLIEEGWLYIFN